jgi:hypothetical protein
MDLQVGGASRLRVQKNGQIYGNGASPYLYLDQTEGSLLGYGAGNYFNSGGTAYLFVYNNLTEQRFDRNGLRVASGHFLAFSSTTSASSAADVSLFRDAADTLAQRRTTNAQTFRIYESFTDASNYTRGSIAATSSGFDITPEAAGTGSKRPVRILGHSLASAEAVSALEINQTWNTTGIPTLIKANVTDTASNANSLLMDLQTGGVSRFSVRKNSVVTVGGSAVGPWWAGRFSASTGAGLGFDGGGNMTLLAANNYQAYWLDGLQQRGWANSSFAWASTVNTGGNLYDTTADLFITRDAAQTLAQRNAGNAQTFRIYNTFTDASNYERGKLEWASNVLRIGTEKAGTGSARALELQTDGTTRLTIGTTGLATFTSDVWTSGDFRVSSTKYFYWQSRSTIRSPADGLICLANAAENDFGRIQLGGTTSSFPAIKRNAAALNFRLADDSADCDITAAALTLSGNLTISTKNIVTDTTTGTKIGTGITQKLAFWNATPVVQPTAVADATDAASVITQLNALLTRMRNLGLIAT